MAGRSEGKQPQLMAGCLCFSVSSAHSSKRCDFWSIFSSAVLSSSLDSLKVPFKGLLPLSPSVLLFCEETSHGRRSIKTASKALTSKKPWPQQGSRSLCGLASVCFQAQPRLTAVTCQVLVGLRDFILGSHGLKRETDSS